MSAPRTREDIDAYAQDHPCPFCGGRDYRIEWVDVGIVYAERIPGTIVCLNPTCPSRARYGPELCEQWYAPPP